MSDRNWAYVGITVVIVAICAVIGIIFIRGIEVNNGAVLAVLVGLVGTLVSQIVQMAQNRVLADRLNGHLQSHATQDAVVNTKLDEIKDQVTD